MPYEFIFSVLDPVTGGMSERFVCLMKTARCRGTNKDGSRCSRKVTFGLPLCWTHMTKERFLKVRPSTIPNAGKGLFAHRPGHVPPVFFAGDEIVRYDGQIISSDLAQARYGDHTAPYGALIDATHVEDAACKRGVGAIANHASPSATNAKLWVVDGKIVLYAERDIFHGQEIFLNYGADYGFDDPTSYRTKYVR